MILTDKHIQPKAGTRLRGVQRLRATLTVDGSVLIVVLVVCLGLVSITLLFGHSMLMAYRGEDNDLAGRQAQYAIEGAARYTASLLANVTTPGNMPDPTLYQREAVPVGGATFWFIGEPPVNGAAAQGGSSGPSGSTGSSGSSGSSGMVSANDQPSFGLVDEASKLNLNRATAAMLDHLPGMTDDLAQAIVAWRSSLTGVVGGTGSSGSTLVLDSGIKNAPFESEEEVAQVNGGTDPSILYGNDTNLNHCLDAEEEIGGLAQWTPGLLEYVTVFSRESNTLSDGTKRISVTRPTASNPLRTLLTSALGSARTSAILRKFLHPPATKDAQPTPIPVGSVLEFYDISGMSPDEFDKVSGKLTATSGDYTTGLVNVNTASATVLACVPGITDATAAQIVSTRQSQTQPSTNLAWVAPIIGQAAVVQAGPYLTTRSYQVSADVAAVGRHGRGYRRTRFVIDSSSGAPQIVYRRDLSSLGWALGSNVRQNLASLIGSSNTAEGAAR